MKKNKNNSTKTCARLEDGPRDDHQIYLSVRDAWFIWRGRARPWLWWDPHPHINSDGQAHVFIKNSFLKIGMEKNRSSNIDEFTSGSCIIRAPVRIENKKKKQTVKFPALPQSWFVCRFCTINVRFLANFVHAYRYLHVTHRWPGSGEKRVH